MTTLVPWSWDCGLGCPPIRLTALCERRPDGTLRVTPENSARLERAVYAHVRAVHGAH